ncbi:MAG: hypothetical protein ABJB16_02670 [Saprospiraceae bacterium]
MQERPQYKITPEQGWSQMQSLLDTSMPLAHRSRRFIVFWWTSAIAVVAILISLFLMKENTPSTDLQNMNTPVSGIAKNEINSSGTESQMLSTSSPIINESKSSAKSADVKMNEGNRERRKNESTSSVSKTSFKNSKKVNSNNNFEKHKSIVIAEKQTNKQNDDLKEIAVVSEADESQKDASFVAEINSPQLDLISAGGGPVTLRQYNSSLGFLPFADVSFYNFADPGIGLIQPANSSFSKARHVFSPNISISAMAGSQRGLGFSAAIGTDYAITSRLSLAASVGLRSYHPGALSQRNQKDILLINGPDPIIADTNYSETYIVGEKVNSSTDYNAINHFVQSIRQWEVSAGLKYTLTKRFFVEGGMVLGFGTTVRSEYPIVTFGSSVNTTADTNVASTFNSYNIISSNMTSLYGGIGYHINRHLSVSVKWTQGLDHYLINDQSISIGSANRRLDYIRGLNLKLAFNL